MFIPILQIIQWRPPGLKQIMLGNPTGLLNLDFLTVWPFPKAFPRGVFCVGSLEVTLSLLRPGKQTTHTELSLVLSCDWDLILTTSVPEDWNRVHDPLSCYHPGPGRVISHLNSSKFAYLLPSGPTSAPPVPIHAQSETLY